MTAEQLSLSAEIIDRITDAMIGETTQQMIVRRLRESGVFAYLKLSNQPLPKLPEDSGLKVVDCGLMFDFGEDGGRVDSFLVYDPRRVEIRVLREEEKNTEVRRGRRSKIDTVKNQRVASESDGWITPFPKSRGRVVSYRPATSPAR